MVEEHNIKTAADIVTEPPTEEWYNEELKGLRERDDPSIQV